MMVRLEEWDVRASQRARAAGYSASAVISKGSARGDVPLLHRPPPALYTPLRIDGQQTPIAKLGGYHGWPKWVPFFLRLSGTDLGSLERANEDPP
jgi:hypothetical protein